MSSDNLQSGETVILPPMFIELICNLNADQHACFINPEHVRMILPDTKSPESLCRVFTSADSYITVIGTAKEVTDKLSMPEPPPPA